MEIKKYYMYEGSRWYKIAQKTGELHDTKTTIDATPKHLRQLVERIINENSRYLSNYFVIAEDSDETYIEKDGENIMITRFYYRGDTFELETTSETLYFTSVESRNDYIEENNLIQCAQCGTYIDTERDYDYIYNEENGETYCSEDCMNEDGYYICHECGEISSDTHTLHGYEYCHDCYYERVGTCEGCGDDVEYDELYEGDDGYMYCSDCLESHNGKKLKEYHTSKNNADYTFYRGTENDTDGLFIGQELEIEAGRNDNEEIAEAIDEIINDDENIRCFFERDGSLTNGVEIISQPATMEAWREIYATRYARALTMLQNKSCRSHDGGACGMHFHLTRDYFTRHEIARFLFVIFKYQEELVKLSRRNSFDYCHKYDLSRVREFSVDDIDERLEEFSRDRYVILNLTNRKTIEYRLTRGTLNIDTFFASVELVYNLSQYVKTKSDDEVMQGKFSDILNIKPTTKLLQYASEKGVA